MRCGLELREPRRADPPHQIPEGQDRPRRADRRAARSEEHTSELQSLMRTSYAVFCLKKKNTPQTDTREQTPMNKTCQHNRTKILHRTHETPNNIQQQDC